MTAFIIFFSIITPADNYNSILILIATIDHVPCTVQLNSTVADAYRAGALPLNTLANAVLVQSDRLRQMASQNYDNGQQETIVRTRGIQ